MTRNLVLCFDGTWNKPEDKEDPEATVNTNVYRFYDLVNATADDGVTNQLKFYNEGVGTEWWNKLGGGAFGLALDEHILEGYRYLITNYQSGDNVYFLGFSRGAYTARSLVGLVRKAGLLRTDDAELVDQAYTLYRTKDESADGESALHFRGEYSQVIQIHCVGVWDTVGALGIPLRSFGNFNQEFYNFHDTKLSGIVRNAFHAVAIDENREPYASTLWGPPDPKDVLQVLEQAWFVGAHADIGGGYSNQPLSDITLRWMQSRAARCGLGLKMFPGDDSVVSAASITDSFKQFLGGLFAKFSGRYYRPMNQPDDGPQLLHESAVARAATNPTYKPKNLNFYQLFSAAQKL